MKTRRIIALLLAMIMIVSLAACGGGSETKSDTTKSGEEAKVSLDETTLEVCIASEPDTIDPALNSAVDGATLLVHLFSGLAKWSKNAEGKLEIVPDAAEKLPEGVQNEDGTVTYTYTLRDGLKWSDGKDVSAKDFEFAWKRAASLELAADYGYMFEVVDGYADITEADDDGNPVNPDAELNVKATDDKTLVVTLANDVPYWNELLAFPVYFPVREDVVANESWATDPSTYVCNGLYKLDSWDHDSMITLKYNPEHPDVNEVKMGTIEFYLSDDSNNMLTNFKNGDWKLIDDVPTDEIATLKEENPDELNIVGQIGTYYVCWNINENVLPEDSKLEGNDAVAAEAEIRSALSLVLDRNYIVNDVSQQGEVPASSFVAMGLTDADGSEFYKNTGVSDDYIGYFDTSAEAFESNFQKAVDILKKYYNYDENTKKFTNMPSLTYLYNTSEAHQAIGEYIQAAFDSVGITMKLENQEWNTFLQTRKTGAFSIARNGWVADYNDPICFLDMWTSVSGNNDIQFGKGDHAKVKAYSLDLTEFGYDIKIENGTWAETYDVLISTIKACTDNDKRYKLMHKAEDILMATGCICPIYYYTDLYMLNSSVSGFFSNPLGYKYFMYCSITE